MKKNILLLGLVICIVNLIGCGEESQKTSKDSSSRPEVTIEGNTFTVKGVTKDISEKDDMSTAITEYEYITDTVFLVNGHINPRVSYLAMFDVNSMDYVGEAYGTVYAFIENDLSSFIYVQDNVVYDLEGNELYTSEVTDTQYIDGISYTEDRKSVSLEIADSDSEETKTETFVK